MHRETPSTGDQLSRHRPPNTVSHSLMPRATLWDFLAAQYQTYRAIDPQDVYKFLYQSVFGPEHSVDNRRAALEHLYLKVLNLPATPVIGPLLEPLSATLCRVHLQPLMRCGQSVTVLWSLFRQTLRVYQPGTVADLQRYWRVFLASPWAQHYAPERLEQFWQHMATAGFPPVHHSRAYAAANAPHYRVVLRPQAEQRLISGAGAAPGTSLHAVPVAWEPAARAREQPLPDSTHRVH